MKFFLNLHVKLISLILDQCANIIKWNLSDAVQQIPHNDVKKLGNLKCNSPIASLVGFFFGGVSVELSVSI